MLNIKNKLRTIWCWNDRKIINELPNYVVLIFKKCHATCFAVLPFTDKHYKLFQMIILSVDKTWVSDVWLSQHWLVFFSSCACLAVTRRFRYWDVCRRSSTMSALIVCVTACVQFRIPQSKLFTFLCKWWNVLFKSFRQYFKSFS